VTTPSVPETPWPARLETERLLLRPLESRDARLVRKLAGAREVADTTLLIPHPYPAGVAEDFIAWTRQAAAAGTEYVFAVTLASSGALVGCVGLRVDETHARAELGYWIGVPYWGRGYATEAARRVVRFAFESLDLNRLDSSCFARNAASARVLEKSGFAREGLRPQHVRRFGRFEDLAIYGLLRGDWQARGRAEA
jgi:RimJ/RimL family protein N-acetyltransferase